MAGKRGNGEGTIWQRDNGFWAGQISYPDPGTGKNKRMSFSGKTRKEVQQKMERARQQLANGLLAEPNKITLGSWMDTWLDQYARAKQRQSTWELHQQTITKHIKPALGGVELRKLQPNMIQKLYNDKLQGGRLDGKSGGLSTRTVRLIHCLLNQALEQAVKEGLIPRNPAVATTPPTVKYREMSPLTPEEVSKFLPVIQNDRLYAFFLLAIFGGLRRGELLALTWDDMDLEAGTVRVTKSMSRTKGGGIQINEPKTSKSKRSIVLPEEVTKELRRHKTRQNEEKLKWGPAYQDQGYVFSLEDGRPLDPRNIGHYFSRLLENNGFRHVRFHDCRHSAAVLMLTAGVNIKVVQEYLGHANAALTLNTYSHVTTQMQQEAANKLNSLIKQVK